MEDRKIQPSDNRLEDEAGTTKASNKLYQCEVCRRTFKSCGSLRVHRSREKKKKALNLPEAKVKTEDNETKRLDNKIYYCEVCKKAFKSSASFRVHRHREHTSKIPSWREEWANVIRVPSYRMNIWRGEWEKISKDGFYSNRTNISDGWKDLFAKRSAPYSKSDILQIKFRFFKNLYPFFGLHFEEVLSKREKKFAYNILDSNTKDGKHILNKNLALFQGILQKTRDSN